MSLRDDDLNDDYVAKLLAEDAKKTSRKYASEGLSAFLPRRRAADAPKPNTRFLSHIVREVDHHNAVLKRKEEAEAARRLESLHATGNDGNRPRKRRRADESDKSKGKRMFRDIISAVQSEKRSSVRSDKDRQSLGNRRVEKDVHRNGLRTHYSSEGRSRSRSPKVKEYRKRLRRHESDESLSSASELDAPVHKSRSKGRDHVKVRSKGLSPPVRNLGQEDAAKGPLTSRTMPEDEVRVRGRGAYGRKAGMNDRLAENYGPSQDVSLDSAHDNDAEDWDMALEALRDRARYQKNQSSRMREAGFSEADISKWEKGLLSNADDSAERNPGDVKWSRRGEVREWDVGKPRE
ncbi:hypothetical protein LTR05_005481 [Lithohypha guttulata]|uniref:Pre-mRNA-splicing factor 38B n=1 Tax=Lithohypha guttulata TaxID=1690604 RepID=A0AAN7YFB3_9EURO|nr:hypothetical protein LTR05_005481 [Lithohypha guttulata]